MQRLVINPWSTTKVLYPIFRERLFIILIYFGISLKFLAPPPPPTSCRFTWSGKPPPPAGSPGVGNPCLLQIHLEWETPALGILGFWDRPPPPPLSRGRDLRRVSLYKNFWARGEALYSELPTGRDTTSDQS